jgi:NADH-quinone oxidoreductase subunit G
MGLALMGGKGLAGAFDEVRSGRADTLVVLENDLYLRAQSALIDELLSKSKHVIVIDHLTNATVIKAQAVLPASTFAEATGTLVNNEARAQRFFSVFAPPGDIQESWRWLRDVGAALGRADMAWRTFDQISAAMAAELPVFSAVPGIAPPASFRASGQKIPRQSHRASGRTAMVVDGRLTEGPPPEDEDSALAFSMEGYKGEPPSALMARFWSPGWNSIQAINKFQIEIGGPLHGGDPGKRLIEPPAAGKVTYFDQVPAAFGTRNGEWLIVGLHHIFGSEELSLLSPGIAQMAPQPYLALSPADAERLQVRPGDRVALDLGVPVDHLPVKVLAGLPQGVAGFPLGLPGMRGLTLPAWGKVRREKEQAGGEGTK